MTRNLIFHTRTALAEGLRELFLQFLSGVNRRATAALIGYIGGQSMLQANLRDALNLARKVEQQREK